MSKWNALLQVIVGFSFSAVGAYRGVMLGEFDGAIAFILGMTFVDVTMLRLGRGER